MIVRCIELKLPIYIIVFHCVSLKSFNYRCRLQTHVLITLSLHYQQFYAFRNTFSYRQNHFISWIQSAYQRVENDFKLTVKLSRQFIQYLNEHALEGGKN